MNHFKSIRRAFQNIKVINTKTAIEKVNSVVTVWGVPLDFNHWNAFLALSVTPIWIYNIVQSFAEDFHELKILQDGRKVFFHVNCKFCLTITDIVERAGRLAGVHMMFASKPRCISKDDVLSLKTLQYSTNFHNIGSSDHAFWPFGFSWSPHPILQELWKNIGGSLMWANC